MATALNRGLRSGIRLLAAGAEASKPGKRPSDPASPGLDLPPRADLGLRRRDSLRSGVSFPMVAVMDAGGGRSVGYSENRSSRVMKWLALIIRIWGDKICPRSAVTMLSIGVIRSGGASILVNESGDPLN